MEVYTVYREGVYRVSFFFWSNAISYFNWRQGLEPDIKWELIPNKEQENVEELS